MIQIFLNVINIILAFIILEYLYRNVETVRAISEEDAKVIATEVFNDSSLFPSNRIRSKFNLEEEVNKPYSKEIDSDMTGYSF